MKKLIGKIRTKDREVKAKSAHSDMPAAQEDKSPAPARPAGQPDQQAPRELFWDDYSDLGYC